MPTEIRYVDDLPVEQSILDAEAEEARKRLDDLVMAEYTETGVFPTLKVREAVAEFEEYARLHIAGDDR